MDKNLVPRLFTLYCKLLWGSFNYLLKTIHFYQHQTSKTNVELRMKHLKVLVKWNWWWNFACVSTKSLNFEIYFLSFPWEIMFWCYFRQLLMYLALENVKNDFQIFKVTLVQIFVHWNLKLLDLLSDFVLKPLNKQI